MKAPLLSKRNESPFWAASLCSKESVFTRSHRTPAAASGAGFGGRTAISDARILAVSETTVTFSWKDRAHGNAKRTETISGVEFVSRYLRHVLPIGLRAIRRYGYCHPAAKLQRERLAFHTGIPLILEAEVVTAPKPAPICQCCKQEMAPLERILARWKMGRDPPRDTPCAT